MVKAARPVRQGHQTVVPHPTIRGAAETIELSSHLYPIPEERT
jgi:hypothetical protein